MDCVGFYDTFERGSHSELERLHARMGVTRYQQKQIQSEPRATQVEYEHHMTLKKHELYPVYVPSRPLSLKSTGNLSQAIESGCGTSKRHFVGRSYDKVKTLADTKQWEELF